MKRRDLLKNSAALGFAAAAIPFSRAFAAQESTATKSSSVVTNKLKPPASGGIPVAFLISDGAVVIDFCGPWKCSAMS